MLSADCSIARAIEPTPVFVSAAPPRSIASSAVRDSGASADHNNRNAGLPFSAASERVVPVVSGNEKSGAGNGSYIHVAVGAEAAVVMAGDAFPVDRGASASDFTSPPSTMVNRVLRGASEMACESPDGHWMVSLSMRWLGPRPISSSFECSERNPEPAVTTRVFVIRSVCTVTRAPTAS